MAAKAIFRFESQITAAGAQVVKTINLMSERHKWGWLSVSDIIIKNGRCTQLSADDALMLVNIALCIEWPRLRRAGNCACDFLRGGHSGPFRRQNMKSFGCTDMGSVIPDIFDSLQDLMRPHLGLTKFQWNATFVGIGCCEMELLQLPSHGYAFVLVVHNPGGRNCDEPFDTIGSEARRSGHDGQAV